MRQRCDLPRVAGQVSRRTRTVLSTPVVGMVARSPVQAPSSSKEGHLV